MFSVLALPPTLDSAFAAFGPGADVCPPGISGRVARLRSSYPDRTSSDTSNSWRSTQQVPALCMTMEGVFPAGGSSFVQRISITAR